MYLFQAKVKYSFNRNVKQFFNYNGLRYGHHHDYISADKHY